MISPSIYGLLRSIYFFHFQIEIFLWSEVVLCVISILCDFSLRPQIQFIKKSYWMYVCITYRIRCFSPHPLPPPLSKAPPLAWITALVFYVTWPLSLMSLCSVHIEPRVIFWKIFVKSYHSSVKSILRIKLKVPAMEYKTLNNFSSVEYKLHKDGSYYISLSGISTGPEQC